MEKTKKTAMAWIIPMLCGLFLFICMKCVFLLGYVPTASMEPTIPAGSYILGLRIHGELRSGDIVVFLREGRELVKRIAAVPGDTISIDVPGLGVTINGAPESAAIVLTVPGGCYFMLGDNAAESFDSRYWTDPFIREEQILAKLLIPQP